MNPSLARTWDPEALWKAHLAISRCARQAVPGIQILMDEGKHAFAENGWGVFASSFNPPTLAHEAILKRALASSELKACLLLLDVFHADKPIEDALLEDRVLMMGIAFSEDPRVALGISSHGRFLDKLRALRGLDLSRDAWTFLVGLDTFARILDPRFYQEPARELTALFEEARFVVFPRPSVWTETESRLHEWVRRGASIRQMTLPADIQRISSTFVRKERALGRPLDRWIHPDVEAFIEETGLYLPTPSRPPLYDARKRVLERLFREGPGRFQRGDLREEALALCRSSSA
jgi:nicotinic acid mononucleotide adenylyltransferase